MKKIILIACLFPFASLANSWNCDLEQGAYTEKMQAQVVTEKENLSISAMGEELTKCESVSFDEEVAEQILKNKLKNLSAFNVDKDTLAKARKILEDQLAKATGGILVMCQLDRMSALGVIVNGDNSFSVLEGGSAYFEMTPGECQ